MSATDTDTSIEYYKGLSRLDTGYFYAPYIPVVHNEPTLNDTGYVHAPYLEKDEILEEEDYGTGSQREPSGDTGTERDDHRPVRSVGDARDVL